MAKKGGGGSQLAQLKSRLHGEGITDRRQINQSAKKRKRGQALNEREDQQARRDKLQKIASSSQFNPFEEKITKPKNAVLGRHIRGATGKPGEARQGGLRDRTENLLPEWKNRNKSGSFVDRRFGEGNRKNLEGMSMEDAMLERFTRERQQRANKTSMFNLDDAEEEGLTHYGRSLNDLDQYDDIHLSDEETAEDRMAHFGGFEDDEEKEPSEEDRQKTKAEVMKEVMAKSKAHKMERQQIKMKDEELIQQLDDDFGDLRTLLAGVQSVPEPVEINEKKDDDNADSKKAKEDAYDAAVREMVFERRAKPQDRLKTEAEKAQELAEKLQKAETDRLRRMRGEEVEKDGGRNAGGDDLDDDFELDGMTSSDVYGLGQGLRSAQQADDVDEDEEAEEDEEEDEEEEEEDDDDKEEEDDDDDDEEEEDEFEGLGDMNAMAEQGEDIDSNEAEEQEEDIVSTKRKQTTVLPFTFPCPSSLDELLSILSVNKVDFADVPIVVKRIRALHHSSLAENNKFKLQGFLGVLLDYILHISVKINESNHQETFNTINGLIPQLFVLTKSYPIPASEHFVSKLALMQRNLTRGLSKGALLPESKTWPGLPECILLKVTSTVWPTSDRSHPVSTPLALLMGQYLSTCRIRNVQDIIKGLYLTSLIVDNERRSSRLVPEALNFLHNAISLLYPNVSTKQLSSINRQFGIPWPDLQQSHAKEIRINLKQISNSSSNQLDFVQLMTSISEEKIESVKAQTLIASFTLVEEFARLYAGSVGFVELFKPFSLLLDQDIANLSSSFLESNRKVTHERITKMVKNASRQRRALRLQAHRAIPIATHIPKFDQGFNPERKGGRTFDPDAGRAEVSKLRALAKKERKGAMRELRRDNEFLADARREAREEEDSRYAKQIDKIMGSLSAERGEEKAYLREKQKLKRRSGKK